jgi:hypothetical protein
VESSLPRVTDRENKYQRRAEEQWVQTPKRFFGSSVRSPMPNSNGMFEERTGRVGFGRQSS